jgi:hypothetical protein
MEMKQGNALGVSAYFIKAHTSKDEILAKIKEILFGSADAKTSDVWDFTQ